MEAQPFEVQTKCPDFEWSSFRMVGTIAQPFEKGYITEREHVLKYTAITFSKNDLAR